MVLQIEFSIILAITKISSIYNRLQGLLVPIKDKPTLNLTLKCLIIALSLLKGGSKTAQSVELEWASTLKGRLPCAVLAYRQLLLPNL
jgi:hypothetical protein